MSSIGETGGSSSAGSDNHVTLVSEKTFKWTITRCGAMMTGNGQRIDFPVEPGAGTPAMTCSFFLSFEEGDYYAYDCWESYNLNCVCATKGNVPPPMYKTKISVLNSVGGVIHVFESGLKNTASRFPIRDMPFSSRNTNLLHLHITLELYGKKTVVKTSPSEQWNNYHEHTAKWMLQDMLKTGHLSDVKIVSKDGQEFHAHKLILQAGSEVFEAMFTHDMVESNSGVVTLSDMSWRAVKFLLHFFYSHELLPIAKDEDDQSGKNHATIEEVLYLASKYRLDGLLKYLDGKIKDYCTMKNAWRLLKLCKMYSLEKGTEVVYAFLLKNQGNLMKDFVLSQI